MSAELSALLDIYITPFRFREHHRREDRKNVVEGGIECYGTLSFRNDMAVASTNSLQLIALILIHHRPINASAWIGEVTQGASSFPEDSGADECSLVGREAA